MANPNAHIHVPFLNQMTVLVGNLGFQSMTDHYETPCITERSFCTFNVCFSPGNVVGY